MKNHKTSTPDIEIDEEVIEDIDIKDIFNKNLVVFNDDHNSFEHVIETLMKVCKHSHEQAEQCTMIIHFKGKCAVKEGSEEELLPFKRAITDAGIDAKIV